MDSFKNKDGKVIVSNMIQVIQENAIYLSEVDGAIGDGDHGINMKKGFSMCEKELEGKDVSFSEGLKILGRILLMEIGGSMGPLYGTFFREMAKIINNADTINKNDFQQMLFSAYEAVSILGKAKVGDKSLLDTLYPAAEKFKNCVESGKTFNESLKEMVASAEEGKDSTKDMIAKIGRAARLGERSRGALDAGATSCYIILKSMAESISDLLTIASLDY